MSVEKLKGGVNLTGCANMFIAIYEITLASGQTIQPLYHPDAEELYYRSSEGRKIIFNL